MVFNTDHMPWELRRRNASEGIWEAHRRSGIFMGVGPHALVRNPSLAQGERGCDALWELSLVLSICGLQGAALGAMMCY